MTSGFSCAMSSFALAACGPLGASLRYDSYAAMAPAKSPRLMFTRASNAYDSACEASDLVASSSLVFASANFCWFQRMTAWL